MSLYLVSRITTGYDQYDSFVVRANSKSEAIELANREESCGNFTECKVIKIKGKNEVILGSFNAG